MLVKWKKPLKYLGTTTLLLLYVTIELYNGETSKREKSLNFPVTPDGATSATDRYAATVKTIVGYSKEFQVRQDLRDRIHCDDDRSEVSLEDEDGSQVQWKHDRQLGISLFSAYHDRREEPYEYIRIIGLVPKNLTLYCRIRYEVNDTVEYVTQKAVIHEIWSASWGANGSQPCDDVYPAIISCLTSSLDVYGKSVVPAGVSFVDRHCKGDGAYVRVTYPPSPEATTSVKTFAVCVKPLHFTNVSEKTLHEWIEINRRLGADRIVMYLSDLTSKSSGWKSSSVEEKRFEKPDLACSRARNFDESLWHKRKLEIIAYNDCLYGHLHRSKFVVPLDVDEVIVPKTGNSWLEGFRSHFGPGLPGNGAWPDTYASFSVRNAYFFSQYPKDVIVRSFRVPQPDTRTKVPKNLVRNLLHGSGTRRTRNSIFDRTLRSYRLSPRTDSVKSFVQVSKTLSVFNHFTFHVLGDATLRQYLFPENVFQLNHYRNTCDPVLIDGCHDFLNRVTYDDSLEKFRNRTIESSGLHREIPSN